MLAVGTKAPAFQAESTQGQVNLSDYIGKQPIVLIFYPKDETPGCTKQLCAVSESKQQYGNYNAAVFGINPGTLAEHRAFAQKQGYEFPIVTDDNETIRKAYGVGKILGLFAQQRFVYIIDINGDIVFAEKGNRPTAEILEVLKKTTSVPH
jgi:peroxiredoxin Q/BCP